jgi:hypothetical protein
VNCDAACLLIECGNGVVQPGEECEPPGTATCNGSCQRIQVCGDGFVDAPEQCDPPNGTTCDAACLSITCGNGVVQPGEECEPPGTASCDAGCQRLPACGDGFVDAPEQCDPPNGTTCDGSCRTIVCGNGIVQPGEECDPPQNGLCTATCQRVAICGDTFVDAPETCDPPDGVTCTATCRQIICGDGVVQGIEECDPPDAITCDVGCVALPCLDPDADDVCLPIDNCPDDPNPDQADSDGDGLGDVCDPCTDTDGDGFGDPGFPANQCPLDVCPEVADPDQDDLDGDGIGDVCDEEDDLLNIFTLKVKASKRPDNPNGGVVAKGDFVVVLPPGDDQVGIIDFFNASVGITVRIYDGLFMDETFDWTTENCETTFGNRDGKLRRIICRTPDRGLKGIFKPIRKNPGAVKFVVKARRRDIGLPFGAPVTVVLTSETVINRVGAIVDCASTTGGIKCREN